MQHVAKDSTVMLFIVKYNYYFFYLQAIIKYMNQQIVSNLKYYFGN